MPYELDRCPICGSEMHVVNGPYGMFLGCITFPECSGSAPIPMRLKKLLLTKEQYLHIRFIEKRTNARFKGITKEDARYFIELYMSKIHSREVGDDNYYDTLFVATDKYWAERG